MSSLSSIFFPCCDAYWESLLHSEKDTSKATTLLATTTADAHGHFLVHLHARSSSREHQQE